jgi:hypothetical protein
MAGVSKGIMSRFKPGAVNSYYKPLYIAFIYHIKQVVRYYGYYSNKSRGMSYPNGKRFAKNTKKRANEYLTQYYNSF